MERSWPEALTGRHTAGDRNKRSFPNLKAGCLTLGLPAYEGKGVCQGKPIYTQSQSHAFPGEGSWPTKLGEFLPSSMSTTSLLPGIFGNMNAF